MAGVIVKGRFPRRRTLQTVLANVLRYLFIGAARNWIRNIGSMAPALGSMTGLLLMLSMGGIEGWTSPLVVAGGVAFVVGAPLFVLVELRVSDPLLDFKLFKNRLFTIANVAQLINGTSRMGMLFLLIFYFQGPAQKDAVTTGILVLPLAGVLFLVSGPSGWISDHIGSRIQRLQACYSPPSG